ncbi:MAG TPA: hypothetical protein VFT64_08560 [Rickettsiales bacterium]|nr:hypothetical protein [Rickettsiales bacterium]
MSQHRTRIGWTPRRAALTALALIVAAIPTALSTSSAPAVHSVSAGLPAVSVNQHVLTGGDTILSLTGTTVQKEDDTPSTFVTYGDAYFGKNGPELVIRFTTRVGKQFSDGEIDAKFNGSHPVIEVSGDTSNLVLNRSSYKGLPYMNVSYKSTQDWNLGFSVEFAPDYEYKGGKYAYPVFYTYDGNSLGKNCEIAGHTTHFKGAYGDVADWFGYNALPEEADIKAWYGKTSPEVMVVSGPTRLSQIGFIDGEPMAYVDFGKDGWIVTGFNNIDQTPFILNAPQKSSASSSC